MFDHVTRKDVKFLCATLNDIKLIWKIARLLLKSHRETMQRFDKTLISFPSGRIRHMKLQIATMTSCQKKYNAPH